MKVVQLLPELNEGGVERGTVELNREMVKRGIESVVISAGGKLAATIGEDGGRHFEFDVCSKNPFTAQTRVKKLRDLLHSIRPDVLHARSRVPAWLAYLANRSLHLPFVTTVHGFNSVNAYSKVMTYGDRVICVSNAIKEYIQQHYRVPDERIVVIPRGVDLDLFDPTNLDSDFIDKFEAEYALKDRIVVTAVGRITQLKDYETFIRGVVQAREKIPHICGLIVGGVRSDKQGYFRSLHQLVRELAAEKLIFFVGSQKRMAEIYSLSDVVVSSSKKPESFGRTAAEALAMNVPVIATNHGGVIDIVQDGANGCLIRPESIEALATAIVSVLSMEVASREVVMNKFSLSSMLDSTSEVYFNSINRC